MEPGETREVLFGLAVGETFRPSYGTAAPLTLEYTVDGTLWRGAVRLPVNAAVAVPAMASTAALASRAPDFTLGTVAKAVSWKPRAKATSSPTAPPFPWKPWA